MRGGQVGILPLRGLRQGELGVDRRFPVLVAQNIRRPYPGQVVEAEVVGVVTSRGSLASGIPVRSASRRARRRRCRLPSRSFQITSPPPEVVVGISGSSCSRAWRRWGRVFMPPASRAQLIESGVVTGHGCHRRARVVVEVSPRPTLTAEEIVSAEDLVSSTRTHAIGHSDVWSTEARCRSPTARCQTGLGVDAQNSSRCRSCWQLDSVHERPRSRRARPRCGSMP